jgi:hypothetical protein
MYPSDIVKIKKIKDRLIIDIEVDSPKDYVIELGSEYLFEPRYYKNWVEFYEFIYKDLQNDIIYNKNYSFNFFTKKIANCLDYMQTPTPIGVDACMGDYGA